MTDKETLLSTKPPEEVITELSSLSEQTGIDMDKIKSKFQDILIQPYLDQFADTSERYKQASKIVLASILDELSFQTQEMEFKVIDKTSIKEIEKVTETIDEATGQKTRETTKQYLVKIFGFFAPTQEGSTKFGILSLWGDACQKSNQFTINNTYRGKFGVTEYEGYYDLYTSSEDFELTPATIPEIPPIHEYITTFFTPVSVTEAEFHTSSDNTDLKLIRGRVKSGRISLNKKGNNMGFINLFDDTKTFKEVSDLTCIFSDSPEMATRYLTGSDIMILGQLSPPDGNYKATLWGQCIIPIIGIPSTPLPPTPPPSPPPTQQTQPPTSPSPVPSATEKAEQSPGRW